MIKCYSSKLEEDMMACRLGFCLSYVVCNNYNYNYNYNISLKNHCVVISNLVIT